MADDLEAQIEDDERTDLTSDTRVEWVAAAYRVRDHWWSRKRRVEGRFIATHVAHPGAWGGGATVETALDELCEVLRDQVTVAAQADILNCS